MAQFTLRVRFAYNFSATLKLPVVFARSMAEKRCFLKYYKPEKPTFILCCDQADLYWKHAIEKCNLNEILIRSK